MECFAAWLISEAHVDPCGSSGKTSRSGAELLKYGDGNDYMDESPWL
jgi:hypothetical protein